MLATMELLCCASYAAAATVFYKKNLHKDGLVPVLLFIVLGLCAENSSTHPYLAPTVAIATLCMFGTRFVNRKWLLTAAKMDMFLAFLLAITDVKYRLCENACAYLLDAADGGGTRPGHVSESTDTGSLNLSQSNASNTITGSGAIGSDEGSGLATVMVDSYRTLSGIALHYVCELSKTWPSWSKLRIVMIAVPQFVRRPVSLKAKLQGVRSKLGPVYVMYVVNYCLQLTPRDDPLIQILCWWCLAIGAVFAGVVLRPDNATMADICHVPSTYSCRKYFHRLLMIGTLIGCLVLLWVGSRSTTMSACNTMRQEL